MFQSSMFWLSTNLILRQSEGLGSCLGFNFLQSLDFDDSMNQMRIELPLATTSAYIETNQFKREVVGINL